MDIEMISKQKQLSRVIEHSGVLTMASSYMHMTTNHILTILAYHRILDSTSKDPYPLDNNLVSASTDAFREQVSWLKKNYDIINFSQLERGDYDKNPIIITFDDGYRDNYLNAYEILMEFNATATIFLTADYIGADKLFWWDEIAYLINTAAKNRIRIMLNKTEYCFNLYNVSDRRESNTSLLRLVKQVSDKGRKDIISQLREQLMVDGMAGGYPNVIMTWEEIKEMSRGGIEFGSHSATHPILSNVPAEGMEYEICESKKKIERMINKEVKVFSYPVGGEAGFNEENIALVKAANYQYATTYINGVNRIRSLDRYRLRRLHVENDDDISMFKSKILFPNIFK